MDEEKR
jgi:hypothetical protein